MSPPGWADKWQRCVCQRSLIGSVWVTNRWGTQGDGPIHADWLVKWKSCRVVDFLTVCLDSIAQQPMKIFIFPFVCSVFVRLNPCMLIRIVKRETFNWREESCWLVNLLKPDVKRMYSIIEENDEVCMSGKCEELMRPCAEETELNVCG